MRKDMITSKAIIKDIRTYVSLMFYLLGLVLQLPSSILYSISNLIKNKDDNF